MNDIPSQDDRSDVDAQYRQAARRDASAPGDTVRQAVLAHAAALAAERSAAARIAASRSPRLAWWRGAALAAAAAVVGLMVWPRTDRVPPSATAFTRQSVETSRYAAAPEPAPTPAQAASSSPAPAASRAAPPAAKPSVTQKSVAAGRAEAQAARSAAGTATAGLPVVAGVLARAAPRFTDADLRQAAALGDVTRLQSILESSAGKVLDINARDADGRTAIMLATMAGAAGAVQLLLAHAADPSIADATGQTPLQVAIAHDHADLAAALRLAGAR